MLDAADSLLDDFEKSVKKGCSEAIIIVNEIQDYTDATREYFSYVGMLPYFKSYHLCIVNIIITFLFIIEKIPKLTNDIHLAIRKYAIEKKNRVIWNCFGILLLFILIFLIGYFCGSRLILRLSMFLTFFLILGLLVLSVIFMIILVYSFYSCCYSCYFSYL